MASQNQITTAGGRRCRGLTLAAATTALFFTTSGASAVEPSDVSVGFPTASASVAESNKKPTSDGVSIQLGQKHLSNNNNKTERPNRRRNKDEKADNKKDKKNKYDDKNYRNEKTALTVDPSNIEYPLLDFAVVGFPKTGTSFMEHYLFNTEETFIDNKENCFTDADMDMTRHLITKRDYTLGQITNDGYRVKNAVKCPKDLMGPHSVANYANNFPEIKFVVSTRHPVWWFQSRYNYKLRQTFKHSDGAKIWAPPTEELLGKSKEDYRSNLFVVRLDCPWLFVFCLFRCPTSNRWWYICLLAYVFTREGR